MTMKRDKVVVAVLAGLTNAQAEQITKDIAKAKRKHAPAGRGTIACMDRENVGKMLQTSGRKALEVKKNDKKGCKALISAKNG